MLRLVLVSLLFVGCQQMPTRSDDNVPSQPPRTTVSGAEPELLNEDAVVARILSINKLKDRVQTLMTMGMKYWFDADSGHCFTIDGGTLVANEACAHNDYRYYSYTARAGKCLNSSGMIVDRGFCPWIINPNDSLKSMDYKR